ncbi:MAG: hypothetical protein AAFR98_05615 [Pseudomonadota bacterium]
MDLGLKISAGAHGVLILLAIFGGSLFDHEDNDAEPITTVTLLSQGEYAALLNEAIPPEPAVEDVEPEVEPEPEPLPEGVTEEGVASDQDQIGELRAEEPTPDVTPEAADIISNDVNIQENPIAEEAPVAQDATEETEGEAEPEPVQEATEQESTTTEIVTEAEQSDETGAPVQTSIPRVRPANRSTPEPEPEQVAEPEEAPSLDELIANSVQDALQEDFGNSDVGEPSPVPLTSVEATGLIFNIQRCWSVPIGGEGAANLRVVLGFDLSRDGFVERGPELVEPVNLGRPGLQQAFEAARRAVLECQPYALPIEKYETWQKLEIEFDPQNMVNR